MRHMSCAMALQLFDPANRDLEWRELIFGHHPYPYLGWRDAKEYRMVVAILCTIFPP